MNTLEQATLARHRLFGVSSEQLSAQSRLFDEAEVLAQLNPEAQDQAIVAPVPQASAEDGAPSKPGQPVACGKRRPLPAELPRVDVIHDVPVAERTCDCRFSRQLPKAGSGQPACLPASMGNTTPKRLL